MEILSIKTRQNEDDQTVYFTLTDNSQTEYQWHADIPQGIDVQDHLEANMERYLLGIRRKEYREAIYEVSEGQTELEAFETWIKDGCKIKTGKDEERIVEKVPWKGTHPPVTDLLDRLKLSQETRDAWHSAKTPEEKIAVLGKVI